MKFLDLDSQLKARDKSNLLREQITVCSKQSTQITVDAKNLINFASNDYLGLAATSENTQAISQTAEKFGFGSGASHLICGHQKPHQMFEESLAEFLQRESVLSFSSGYMANLGILQTLAKKGNLILADKLNHASLIDGVKLSQADSQRYLHLDMGALEKKLSRSTQNAFVVTDSVFSMDGDIAPLDVMADLCDKYNAILIVDDAHGFGVLGKNGQGAGEYFELNEKRLPVLMSSFGKALGGYGAAVSGEKKLVSYLMQTARNYIYTTATPAIIAAGNLANLQLLKSNNQLIKKLKQNTKNFQQLAKKKDLAISDFNTPIQPIIIGENERLIVVKNKLYQQGFLVGAVRPPTVAKGSARLRITISAKHTFEQIEQLINAIDLALRTSN